MSTCLCVCVCLFVINYRITQSIRRTAANVSVVTSSLVPVAAAYGVHKFRVIHEKRNY